MTLYNNHSIISEGHAGDIVAAAVATEIELKQIQFTSFELCFGLPTDVHAPNTK